MAQHFAPGVQSVKLFFQKIFAFLQCCENHFGSIKKKLSMDFCQVERHFVAYCDICGKVFKKYEETHFKVWGVKGGKFSSSYTAEKITLNQ